MDPINVKTSEPIKLKIFEAIHPAENIYFVQFWKSRENILKSANFFVIVFTVQRGDAYR